MLDGLYILATLCLTIGFIFVSRVLMSWKEFWQEKRRIIKWLKKRDKIVKSHENFHHKKSGKWSRGIKYEYMMGPNGKQYKVGGCCGVDLSLESNPHKTIKKMKQIQKGAIPPRKLEGPSQADWEVFCEAKKIEMLARQQRRKEIYFFIMKLKREIYFFIVKTFVHKRTK